MVGFRRSRRGVAAFVTSLVVVLALGWSAQAQTVLPPDTGPVTLTADHIEYDTQTGNVVADGHVVAVRGGSKITADHLDGNLKSGDVQAMGHVVLTQPGRKATGEALKYNYRTRVGEMTQAVATYTPWTITGRTMSTASGQGAAMWASATPCDPAHPAFRVTARKVVVVPDNYLTAYDAILYVYGVPVFYLPQYTTSLKPSRNAAGPTLGYDNYNGVWAAYTQYIPLGDWDALVTAFFGTRSGLSGSLNVDHQFPDYLLNFHFGRAVSFDQMGNQFNLDQNTVDATFNQHTVFGLPGTYVAVVQVGTFYESETGARATRTEGVLTVTSDTINLNKNGLTLSAGGYFRYDAYTPGNVRNIIAGSAAVNQVLTATSSTTLSYNFATVYGVTPFLFDGIGTDSSIGMSYSYYPGGLFSSGTLGVAYDFLSLQTTASLYLGFTISPTLQFSSSISYNVNTQQVTEIDYAVNATCDCVSLGVVYTTFPNAPLTNRWYITVGINTLPGISTTYKLGGTP